MVGKGARGARSEQAASSGIDSSSVASIARCLVDRVGVEPSRDVQRSDLLEDLGESFTAFREGEDVIEHDHEARRGLYGVRVELTAPIASLKPSLNAEIKSIARGSVTVTTCTLYVAV